MTDMGAGFLAGFAGLCVVPALLSFLLKDKNIITAVLSFASAIALMLCVEIFIPQIHVGVFVAYFGVILLNICTSGYRHERKDGGADRRYSAVNNPFYAGLFLGAMWRALAAFAVSFLYKGITTGNWGPLAILMGPVGGFISVFVNLFK